MTPAAGHPEERERDFHDRVYESGEYRDRPANRFYAVAGTGFNHYHEALRSSIQPGSTVLECGCGEGSYALRLARLGANVTGVDISDVAIRHAASTAAAEGLASATDFRTMNLEQLEFADHSYDIACGEGVLHHVDLGQAVGEIARVLRPEGRAVFLEPLGHNPLINLYRRFTPAQRTEDEHPLMTRDLEHMQRHFSEVSTEFFNFLSLATMALRPGRAFDRVLASLDRADQAVFRALPFTRRYAWIAVIRLSGPR